MGRYENTRSGNVSSSTAGIAQCLQCYVLITAAMEDVLFSEPLDRVRKTVKPDY